MRVLYYHQHFSTPAGMTGTRSYELARRLIASGHSVLMVCGSYGQGSTGLSGPFVNGARRGNVDGIDVIEFHLPYSNHQRFRQRLLVFFRFAWRSIGVAMRERYDLVFATSTPLTAGIPGIVARWLRGKRFVFEVRDLWPELPRAMGLLQNPTVITLMTWLEWMSYHSAHACIGLSPGMVEGIARRGIPRERIALIPNGCDLDLFGEAAGESWRPEGVRMDDLMAVFCGTHGFANGLDAVLDAAAELKRRGRDDIKLVLVGEGKLKGDLVSRARAEQLELVVFLSPMPKTRLAGLMKSADLGLMILANVPAFYFGTSPNKFFDYLASGIPVLTNYPGWVANLIEANDCGAAVVPDNPQAFADALEALAVDPLRLREMGQRAHKLGQCEFDRNTLSRRFVDVLESAARGGPLPA